MKIYLGYLISLDIEDSFILPAGGILSLEIPKSWTGFSCPADGEFPSQVSFTVPARLEEFWHLDAIWGLMQEVVAEHLEEV